MPPFYESDSEPRWWLGIGSRFLLAFLVISILSGLIGAAFWLVGVVISDPKGQGDLIKERNSKTNRIFQQQHFQDTYAEFRATVDKIDFYSAAAKTGDPTAQTNLIGLRSHCLDVAHQYNQDSAKVLASKFKTADLPVSLDPTECKEH